MKIQRYSIITFLFLLPVFLLCQTNTWVQRNDIGTSIKNGPPYSFQHPTFSFSTGNKGYIGIISDTSNVTFMFEFDATTNNWVQKASLPGKLRGNAFNFSIGAKGYVGGGSNYPTSYIDFWEYDPAMDLWTRKADLPFVLSGGYVGFSSGTKGYIVLGYNVSNSTNLWEYDPSTNLWTTKANFPGVNRSDAVAFSVNGNGYVGLGYYSVYANGSNQTLFVNDIWEYNPAGNTWTRKADYPGAHRYGRIGAGLNGKGYVGTGEQLNGETTSNEFWEFDPIANTWSRKKDFFDDARYSAAKFVINNQLYIGMGYGRIGNEIAGVGNGVGQPNDLWLYDETNDSWDEKRALEYDDAKCSFKINGTGYILLSKYNYTISKTILALFAYDTTYGTWSRKADFPSSDIIWGSGSFTIGSKAYIVSGADSDLKVAYKDVYEYDPSFDKWTKKANFPGDGRRNIITFSINGKGYAGLGWGASEIDGLPSAYKLNDFWEYDPSGNNWVQKADFSDQLETAFFNTDSKGYVLIEGSPLDKVFEFDPLLNSWTQKNDFPGRPRGSALGMNIGNKGYLFGGSDDLPVSGYYIYLKDMWEYNSANDIWTLNVDFPGYERSTKIGFSIGNKLFLGSGLNQTMHPDDWWEGQPGPTITQYVFTGNGNWTDTANWAYGKIPPAILPSGSEIIIDPPTGKECILNSSQTISAGGRIIIGPNKKFRITGNLSTS